MFVGIRGNELNTSGNNVVLDSVVHLCDFCLEGKYAKEKNVV